MPRLVEFGAIGRLASLATSGWTYGVLASCLFSNWACSSASGATPNDHDSSREILVRTADVNHAPIARPIRVPGMVVAKEEAALAFGVAGTVTAVYVEQGRALRRGAVLARLEPFEHLANAAQHRAMLERAELELQRTQVLETTGAIASVDVQNSRTNVAIARAAMAVSTYQTRQTTLVAPSDGWVVKKVIATGEVVNPGQPAIIWSSASKGFVVKVTVTDREVFEIELGRVASVVVDAFGDHQFTGRVTQIAKTASPVTGGFGIEIAIDGADRLRAGLSAKVSIERMVQLEGTIPAAALVSAAGANGSVFVLDADGHRARRVPITIAFLTDDGIAVQKGLRDVSQVITDGASRLVDGERVQPVK